MTALLRSTACCTLAVFASSVAFAALTPEEKRLNRESFEYVWTTVRDKHWDKKPGGLDWQSVHDELLPKVDAAESRAAARAVIAEMLGRLHQSHFGIIPGDIYERAQPAADAVAKDSASGNKDSGDLTAGLDVRVVDHDALVTSIEADSDAARAGVHAGWIVLRANGVDVHTLIANGEKAFQGSTRELMLRHAVLDAIDEGHNGKAAVEFRDGENQVVTKSLTLAEQKGSLAGLGYLTPQHVWIYARRLNGIEYVKFNFFLDPERLMATVAQAVKSCTDCRGFIIDLRGNPGGIAGMASGMSGDFVKQPGQLLGTLYMRTTTLKLAIFPQAQVFSGPLAILVDGTSASTSEILAGGLKDLGRAHIFGTPTAAAALPSVFEKLPNGDAFQYAMANYISEGGKALEGNGVVPDEVTPLTRAALLAGQDPALDAALKWIDRENLRTTK